MNTLLIGRIAAEIHTATTLVLAAAAYSDDGARGKQSRQRLKSPLKPQDAQANTATCKRRANCLNPKEIGNNGRTEAAF
jgi:hypothetical protein